MLGAASVTAGAWGYGTYLKQQGVDLAVSGNHSSIFTRTGFTEPVAGTPMVDFEKAANKAAPSVVHIRTISKGKQVSGGQDMDDDLLKQFFGHGFGNGLPQAAPQQRASGSGVLISADGYIVTNNHVVEGADQLTVTLNNKDDYKAKVVGVDPSTDLAVIKIEAKNLPYLSFANSDNVHLGQWVLAIGYPLDLQTTVTSGIVSAKGRNIGINGRNSSNPVESFIQTDAAVNPGNSGGALCNTDGDVIGINSAIASPTGSYAGYAYAIPSNLVQKVAADIIKYGSNKRAYLGIMYPSDQMTEEDRQKNNVREGAGVFVMDVAKGSTAEEAGLQKGDFIRKINGEDITTGNQVVEKISTLRPGDKVTITYSHDGSEKTATAALKGISGTYASIREQVVEKLGCTFQALDNKKGVAVKSIGQGILADQTRIREGFIITKVNDQAVGTVDELRKAIADGGNSVIISGIYPNDPSTVYQYALNDLNAAK